MLTWLYVCIGAQALTCMLICIHEHVLRCMFTCACVHLCVCMYLKLTFNHRLPTCPGICSHISIWIFGHMYPFLCLLIMIMSIYTVPSFIGALTDLHSIYAMIEHPLQKHSKHTKQQRILECLSVATQTNLYLSNVCTHTHRHTHTHAHMHTCMCTHTHMHAHTLARTHTCPLTCVFIDLCFLWPVCPLTCVFTVFTCTDLYSCTYLYCPSWSHQPLLTCLFVHWPVCWPVPMCWPEQVGATWTASCSCWSKGQILTSRGSSSAHLSTGPPLPGTWRPCR